MTQQPQQPQQVRSMTVATPDSDAAATAAAEIQNVLWRVENARSFLAIPMDDLPSPQMLLALVRLALDGAEIYAYQPAGKARHVIWHRQRDAWAENRFSLEDWAAWATAQGYMPGPLPRGTMSATARPASGQM